jgi:hypothetical protein
MLDLITLHTLNAVFDAEITEEFDAATEALLAEIDAEFDLDNMRVAVPNKDETKFRITKFKNLDRKGR